MTRDECIHTIATNMGKEDSKAMHDILDLAITSDEAQFILELPALNKDLAAKFNITEEAVEKKVYNLAQRGIIIPSKKGYYFNTLPVILHDHMLSSKPDFIPDGMDKLWMNLYKKEDWWKEIGEMYLFLSDPLIRVAPAESSIPEDTPLLPQESLTRIIEANKDLISVRNCCCRTGANDCDHPRDVCIQFKKRAEFDLHRGSGRKVSADEAIAISKSAVKSGLVPTVTNLSDIDKLQFICFCCSCACLILDPGLRMKTLPKILNPSRFQVKINHETCKSCKVCMKRCQFDAISMKEFPAHEKPKAVVDPDKCLGCGICQVKCKSGSITMESVRPKEFIPDSVANEEILDFFD